MGFPDRLTPGTRFGRYEIIREIGVGRDSIYYLAAEGIALQVFWMYLDEDDHLAMHFRDAGLATILDHPNLVRLLDTGRAEGQFYFAHEYVDGASLHEIRRRRGPAPWRPDAAVALALGMTDGLAYLHDATTRDGQPLQWVHRRLDPTSVFVTRDGIVKVSDLAGLRLSPRPGVLEPRISRYLSPEQVRGRPVDSRADLFALGAILYEVSTGRRPFEGPNEFETLAAIVMGPLAPPSTLVAGYSPGLERLVTRALERDLDRRYQTATELGRDLRELARAESLDVSPGVLAELAR